MGDVADNQESGVVEHNYKDYSRSKEGEQQVMEVYGGMTADAEQSFPFQLHLMLGELEAVGLSDVLSWQSHGRCFLVHNKERFVKEVLPR